MAKFTGGAVPLIARPHDVLTHGGLLHRINISYNGTESRTVRWAVGARTQIYVHRKAATHGLVKKVSSTGLLLNFDI